MSIYRISSNTITDNGVHHLHDRKFNMDRVNQQLNTGKKHRLPRENVTAVTQAMTFHSKIHKLSQFLNNIQDAESERSLVEVKIMDTVEILQRARELAIQGSNGILNDEQRDGMSTEIDQLLKNVILSANSKYKGNFLFSGFQKYTQPFEVIKGAVRDGDHAMIKEVRYLGDNGSQLREIDNGEYIATSLPGSELFWAENFQIYSNTNTANFRMTKDMNILIDGVKIEFNAGDNIYAVMDKINRSPASVNASVDIVNGGLILKSSVPHKLELADIEGGTLLQDLGILERGFAIGPDNYNNDATIFGGSVFDVLIGLRDSFISNNSDDIGGRFLGSLDNSIDNLMYRAASTGSLYNRLEYLTNRIENDKESFIISLSAIEDIDIADSITQLKQLEYAHTVALSSLARLSQTSLMDFLR